MTDSDSDATAPRILVAEDALDDAFFLKELLRSAEERYEVAHAQDGETAIRMLGEQRFDLLITDLNLPGKDGVEVMESIRERGLDVPVLVITGYTNEYFSDRAFRAGAKAVMQKPIDRSEFLGLVRGLVADGEPERESRRAVLAVGARPGDVEAGCGGTLAQRATAGEAVLVIHLSRHLDDSGSMDDRAAGRCVRELGARLHHPEIDLDAGATSDEVLALLEGIADELAPHVAFVPSPHELDPLRNSVHRMARRALSTVPTVLGYVSSSSTDRFAPDHFVDITGEMERKAASLDLFKDSRAQRTDLLPEYARAEGRSWARKAGIGEHAEPFMVLEHPDSP